MVSVINGTGVHACGAWWESEEQEEYGLAAARRAERAVARATRNCSIMVKVVEL